MTEPMVARVLLESCAVAEKMKIMSSNQGRYLHLNPDSQMVRKIMEALVGCVLLMF